MKAPHNRVVLKPVDRDIEVVRAGNNSWNAKMSENGLLIPIIGNEYDPEIIEQYGEVVAVCESCSQQVDNNQYLEHKIILQPGDLVLAHHFLRDRDQKIEGGYSVLFYWQIFGKVDGDELMPNCDWNFLRPLVFKRKENKVNGVILPKKKVESNFYAEVLYPSTSLLELGAKIGDVVVCTGNTVHGGEYDILFKGEKLIRVDTREIACVVYEGLDDRVLLSGLPEYKEKS